MQAAYCAQGIGTEVVYGALFLVENQEETTIKLAAHWLARSHWPPPSQLHKGLGGEAVLAAQVAELLGREPERVAQQVPEVQVVARAQQTYLWVACYARS